MYNQGVNKRRHYDEEVIDLPYLLNASRILSEKEFERKLPTGSYSQYFEHYLQRKIIYNGDSKKFIQISNIPESYSISEICEKLSAVEPSAKLLISQNGLDNGFKKNVVIIGDGFDPELAIKSINTPFSTTIIDFSNFKIVTFNMARFDQIKNVFEALLKYERGSNITDDAIDYVKSSNNADVYVDFLRDAFYFCTNCCKKFDNQFEMLTKCKNHTQNDYCERTHDILGYLKNIDATKQFFESIEEHYTKTLESNLICKICKKTFTCMEYFNKH